MGVAQESAPVLLVFAVMSRYSDALEWARERAEQQHGAVTLISDAFDFTETDYYTPTMGTQLKKQFLAFERMIDPEQLASIKRRTNEWEAEYAALGRHPELRPLNLDPGYMTAAKLVLASTKDHAHRIYLRDGVYAEVTLAYRQRRWQPMEWTYPDYRRDDYQEFFTQCREVVLNCGSGSAGVK
jgi:hypothetical protein